MHNTRFATLIHLLTLLAKSQGQWLSSEEIARSIGINPVVVRKELSALQEMGWVISKKGKEGGSMLHVSSCEISLADIYKLVKNSSVLGRKNACAGSDCPVGKRINTELEGLFEETDALVIGMLQHKSLTGFVEQFDKSLNFKEKKTIP